MRAVQKLRLMHSINLNDIFKSNNITDQYYKTILFKKQLKQSYTNARQLQFRQAASYKKIYLGEHWLALEVHQYVFIRFNFD